MNATLQHDAYTIAIPAPCLDPERTAAGFVDVHDCLPLQLRVDCDQSGLLPGTCTIVPLSTSIGGRRGRFRNDGVTKARLSCCTVALCH